MKNQKVYISPDVQGIYILQSVKYHGSSSQQDFDIKQESEKEERESEEKRIKEFQSAMDEAYRQGKLDAEEIYKSEIERLRNEYASLITLLQSAVKDLTDKRETIWQESESEIIRLILNISKKIVGYEISNDSIHVLKHIVKDAISYASDKKIIAIRISPHDVQKIESQEVAILSDQNISFVEDKTVDSGGCIVETDFGSVDSMIETRCDEILKTLQCKNNESTVH